MRLVDVWVNGIKGKGRLQKNSHEKREDEGKIRERLPENVAEENEEETVRPEGKSEKEGSEDETVYITTCVLFTTQDIAFPVVGIRD